MIKTTIGFALLATTFLSSAASAFDITTDDLLEKLSNSPNVSWEEVGEDKKDETDVIAVNLPNDQTKYFRYTYSKPDGYEVITKPELMLPTITDPSEQNTYQTGGVAVNNPAGNKYGDITGKVFANNKVSGKLTGTSSYNNLYILGGAVYNAGEIGDITADFINNSLTGIEEGSNSLYLRGGAIYNSDTGTIGNITGNFIGNYASKGAVYSVRDAAYGGAIYNDGTIGNITGNFIGNYTSSTTKTAYTGAISNSGTIGDITGNFIANHTLVNAGAILNGAPSTVLPGTSSAITPNIVMALVAGVGRFIIAAPLTVLSGTSSVIISTLMVWEILRKAELFIIPVPSIVLSATLSATIFKMTIAAVTLCWEERSGQREAV